MGKIANFLIASESNNFRPPVLSYKAFLIYGLILILLRILLTAALPAQSAAVESTTLMGLINQERQQRNISVLFTHPSLLSASAQKSQDMIDRDYFNHIDPDGNYIWGKIVAAGYTPYQLLGENLAVDFATSEGIVKAWLDSPSHRANLLNTQFVDQGLTALYGDYQGRYTNLTASLFGALVAKKQQSAYSTPYGTPYTTPYATPYPTPALEEISKHELKIEKPVPPLVATTTSPIVVEPENKILSPIPKEPVSPLMVSRIIFTLFGFGLLSILATDSVIIYKHAPQTPRSHSSYHSFGFMLIVLVSILIWWW